jgi:hypothetical protein
MFTNIITNLDQFGRPVSLRINKKTTLKTFLGGILTITLIFYLIAMLFINMSSVWSHKSPRGNLETLLDPNPYIVVDSMHIPFGFFVGDSDNVNIGTNFSKYFSISISLLRHNNTKHTYNITTLQTEKCTQDHFPQLRKDSMNTMAILDAICMKKQDNFVLFGGWDQQDLQYLYIELKPCKNTTANQCPPFNEIQEKIKYGEWYFNLLYVDEQINPYEFINYSSVNLNIPYRGLKSDQMKLMEMYISNVELDSDNGFLYSDKKNYKSLRFDRIEYDEMDLPPDSTFLIL